MKSPILILWAFAVALQPPCLWAGTSRPATQIVRANNEFGSDLYAGLAIQPGNLVVSPFSISTALGMTYAGARNETARQMAKVLHFPNDSNVVHLGYGDLTSKLNESSRSGFKMVFVNALFAQKGYPFLRPFQEILRDKYSASLNPIDLTGWPNEFDSAKAAAARKQINDWVADRTQNKITEILPSSLPNEDTRMILANAIWLKGKWTTPFLKVLTTDAPFHLDAEKSVSVPTMRLTADFRYAENDALQILELPYASGQFAMVVLLPKKGGKLDELDKTLTSPGIEALLRRLKTQKVQVSFPRFKAQSSFVLNMTLQAMGLKSAFGIDADFSGITLSKPFFIQAAVHSAWVDVDEEGTEAAAATAFVLPTKSTASLPIVFSVDHPFVFLIRDNKTGLILFLGRVTDPSKE